ncbi:MAG: hypothetical protein WCL18_00130 [bacterium]
MNYSLKNVNPTDIILWVNEAISQKVRLVAVLMQEQSHDANYEPYYLDNDEVEKQLIKLINQDDEEYALRFVIDVEAEVEKGINEGHPDINYKEAKKLFPKIKVWPYEIT